MSEVRQGLGAARDAVRAVQRRADLRDRDGAVPAAAKAWNLLLDARRVTRRGLDVLDRGETGRRNGRAHLPASAARAHGPVADDPRDEASEAGVVVAYAERLVGDAVRYTHGGNVKAPAR
jgi:hypothetical protein